MEVRLKKAIRETILAGLGIVLALSPAFAAAVSKSAPVSLTVDQVLTLNMAIYAEDQNGTVDWNTKLNDMNFGTLIRSNDATGKPNALRGSRAFHVLLSVNTSRLPYNVTATMNSLVSGVNTLPRAAGCFPIQATDGAKNPVSIGGALASKRDAVGNYEIYRNTEGKGGVIEVVYGVSGGGDDGKGNFVEPFPSWQAVPPDQPAGTYASTIIFTLTA